jgi:VWFA-related protein
VLAPLLAVAAALGPPPGTAQPLPDTFADRVAVIEVEVPVQVLRDGRPVRGLRAEDFVVLDRGRERAITGFQVVDLSGVPADEGGAAASGTTAEDPSRSVLVIFDFQFASAGLLARAVESVRELVDAQLRPSDRVAIVVLGTRSGAAIVTGFTSSSARTHLALDLVRALLDRKSKRQRELIALLAESAPASAEARAMAYGEAASVAFGAGLASVAIEFDTTIDTGMADEVLPGLGRFGSGAEEAFQVGARLGAFQDFQHVANYAEALGNLAVLLRDVEGQKLALLLSQGPPITHLSAFAGPDEPEGAALVAGAMEDLFELLGRSGWRLFTFGQRLEFDAQPGGSWFKDSLHYLARETGGVAYESFNRLHQATALFVEQTSVSYALHFLADGLAPDGRRHRLEVRLREPLPGVTVTHRPAYYAPRPADQLDFPGARPAANAEGVRRDEVGRAELAVNPRAEPRASGCGAGAPTRARARAEPRPRRRRGPSRAARRCRARPGCGFHAR